jgi:hypothetical protein
MNWALCFILDHLLFLSRVVSVSSSFQKTRACDCVHKCIVSQKPKTFIADQHDGRLAALRELVLRSKTVSCAKYLGENIRQTRGNRSPVVRAFWAVLHREIHENKFLQELKTEFEYHAANSRQEHMLQFLETNFEHFSPVRVAVATSERVSSRVERFFGHYKTLTRHKVLPLVDAVAGNLHSRSHDTCWKISFSGSQAPPRDSVRARSEQVWNIHRDNTSR